MSTEMKDRRRATRHGFWFGIFVGGLSGALLAGVVVNGATVSAAPALAAKAFGHRFGGHGLQDPEVARERAELAADFILKRVEATEAQQAAVKRLVSETIDDLLPLAEQHRAYRVALHDELSGAEIDADAIEQIRQSEMALAESASRELSQALTAFAEMLTAEQRAEILSMARRFRH